MSAVLSSGGMPQSPPPFIYLATPCYGGQADVTYLHSVLALQSACEARGVGLHVELLGDEALITRARSRLAARFLAHPQATHLLFVDADIGFAPDDIFRLLESAKDLIGSVYPLKGIDWEKVRAAAAAGAADLMAKSVGYVVRFIPTPDSSVEVDNGMAKVSYVGTGLLMIRRGALERIVAAHPELTTDLSEIEPHGSRVVMIFDTMVEPGTGQHLSEDYAFERRWADIGGEIWADMGARLTHVGRIAYVGSLIEGMRAG